PAQGRSYGPGSIIVGQSNYHGDPSAALLEVLDPEQNVAFNILFICTANSLDTISPPIGVRAFDRRNRTVQGGRVGRARRRPRPRTFVITTPLPAVSEPSDALVKRSKEGGVGYNPIVEADELEKILGLSRHDGEDREREARRGVVWGLVVTGMGEGDQESAELALSWIKTHSYDLGITSKRAQDPLRIPDAMIDIHLHLPAGAQKKDGPSAGVAMVCAMVSLLTGKCVPPTTAMTGEITLRGRVSPVGGVKEKVLGAHRAGANKVIVPWANRKDVEHDVPKEVRARMQFVFARTVREVLDAAFGEGALPWRTLTPVVESRL
ncbi:Lon protease C-terminal proteolytic domain-containing protein, partial [Lactarius pseudohatsudake]